jgi:hypothetical protein
MTTTGIVLRFMEEGFGLREAISLSTLKLEAPALEMYCHYCRTWQTTLHVCAVRKHTPYVCPERE